MSAESEPGDPTLAALTSGASNGFATRFNTDAV